MRRRRRGISGRVGLLASVAVVFGVAGPGCSDDGAAAPDGALDGSAPEADSGGDGAVSSGDCRLGEAVPEGGCTCEGIPVRWGWCCADGWRPIACEPEHRTCADLDVANCVEVYPGQSGDGYEYHEEQGVYFFRDLSNDDHYFLLMGDIECPSTCAVFGFQDGRPDRDATTTFDLNGYTVSYSADDYELLPNNDFEDWSAGEPDGWSVESGEVEARDTTTWMPMHGEWVLYTPSGATLVSSSISLPRARWYQAYVTVGRADESRDITLQVLDGSDRELCRSSKPGFFRGQTISCRFLADGPQSVRLRIEAGGEAYLDRTGIVPLGDYAVAALTAWSLSENNERRLPVADNLAGLDIPTTADVADPDRFNHLRVTNGIILAASENQESEAVRTTGIVWLTLDHVLVRANGIKSHTVRARGSIHHNRLEANMPWYFARENSDEENVILRAGSFHDNLAIGGQGVIRLGGVGTKVYRNYIRNDAQATNHYAIIHSGAEDAEIYENVFDPIEGSGILTYRGHGYRIHDNVFYVRTATCNVEYVNEDYSTNGIRMNDYGSEENRDNWVYRNRFEILGVRFETAWPNCMPVTTGIFYSASGADNRIFENVFRVIKTHDDEDQPVYALYMGGDVRNQPEGNPLVTRNRFEANDKAVWIATFYGSADGLWFEDNTFVRLPNDYYDPPAPEAAIRIGYWRNTATHLHFVNNRFEGGFQPGAFQFTGTSESGAYDLAWQWYLHVRVWDGDGRPVEGATVRAVSEAGLETVEGTTDASGLVTLVVTEFLEQGDTRPDGVHDRTQVTPHTVEVEHQAGTARVEGLVLDHETTLDATIEP